MTVSSSTNNSNNKSFNCNAGSTLYIIDSVGSGKITTSKQSGTIYAFKMNGKKNNKCNIYVLGGDFTKFTSNAFNGINDNNNVYAYGGTFYKEAKGLTNVDGFPKKTIEGTDNVTYEQGYLKYSTLKEGDTIENTATITLFNDFVESTSITLSGAVSDTVNRLATKQIATNAANDTYKVTAKDESKGSIKIEKVTAVNVIPPTAKTNLTYNNSELELVTAGTATNGTLMYRLGTNGTWSDKIPKAKNAGTYTVYWYVKGNGSYSGVGSETNPNKIENISIAAKNITPTISVGDVSAYDGNAKTPTITVYDGETEISESEYQISWDNNINAGTDTAKVIITDNDGGNYSFARKEQTFSIQKANILSNDVTVPQAETELVYNESSHKLVTAGSVKDEIGTVYYKLGESGTWSKNVPTAVNAGKYTVYWYVKGNSNHNDLGSSTNPYEIKDISIGNASMASDVTASDYNAAYDGENHTISVKAPAGATVTYSSEKDGTYTSTPIKYKNAGSYTVYYKVTKTNYNEVTGSAKVNITAKTINPEISVGDVSAYDGKEKTPTITVYDGETKILESEYQVSWDNNINAGTNTAKVIITDNEGGNYSFTQKKQTFSIPKADILSNDVTAPQAETELVYDEGSHKLVTAGSVKDEIGTVYYKVNDGNWDTDIPEAVNAGTYTVYWYVKGNSNHNDLGSETEPQGTISNISVGNASMNLSVSAENYSDTYDGENHTISVKAPAGATITYSETEKGEFSENPINFKNATDGAKTVYYKVSKTNYDDVTGSATVTINKKDVTVIPTENQSKVYGSEEPTLTYDTDGLVEGDELEGALSRAEGSDAGEYSFSVENLTNANYNILLAENAPNFRIIPKKLENPTVEITGTYTYDGTEKKATITVKDGETVIADGYSISYDNNINAGTNTAEVTVRDTNADDNYEISETKQMFSIGQREITGIKWSDTELVYNGLEQAPKAEAEGLVNNDICNVTVTGAQKNANEEGKPYTATADSLDNSNYKLPDIKPTTEFTIAKRNSSVNTPTGKKFTYKNADCVLVTAGSVDGGKIQYALGTDDVNPPADHKFSDDLPKGRNAGTYYIWYRATGSANYNSTAASCITSRIEKAIPQFDAVLASYTYDGTAHKPTIKGVYYGNLTYTYFDTATNKQLDSAPSTPGSYKVKVRASGNENYYALTIIVNYTISAKDVSGAKITFEQNSFDYDNTEKTPKFSVQLGGKKLTANTDYTVSGDFKAKEPGSYTLTITGKGNYNGSVSAKWTIVDNGQQTANSAVKFTYKNATAKINQGNRVLAGVTGKSDNTDCTIVKTGVIYWNASETPQYDLTLENVEAYSNVKKLTEASSNVKNGQFLDNGYGVTVRGYSIVSYKGHEYTVYADEEYYRFDELAESVVKSAVEFTYKSATAKVNQGNRVCAGVTTKTTDTNCEILRTGIIYWNASKTPSYDLTLENVEAYSNVKKLTEASSNVKNGQLLDNGYGVTVRGYSVVSYGGIEYVIYADAQYYSFAELSKNN